jgi:hypothetical protein
MNAGNQEARSAGHQETTLPPETANQLEHHGNRNSRVALNGHKTHIVSINVGVSFSIHCLLAVGVKNGFETKRCSPLPEFGGAGNGGTNHLP